VTGERVLGVGALAARVRAFLGQSHREAVELLHEAAPTLEEAQWSGREPPPRSVGVNERHAMDLLHRIAMAYARKEDGEKPTVRVPRQILIDTMAFLLDATREAREDGEHELLRSV